MPQIVETTVVLERLFEHIQSQQKRKEEAIAKRDSSDVEEMIVGAIEEHIQNLRSKIRTALESLVRFPPHHVQHFESLKSFWQKSPCNKAVFIMTKFPDGESPEKDAELNRVITAVKAAVSACDYYPRIADEDGDEHAMLWSNVELYLLGCQQGIAIVEDRYRAELNPNVTLEWGWMRAMGRRVLYLVEESFDRARADLSGFIRHPFKWQEPEPRISEAVKNFLLKAGPL